MISFGSYRCQELNKNVKLYFPISHYEPRRRLVFPLLRPFIKDTIFTDVQRVEIYSVSEQDFEFTNSLVDADLVILTMAWNYYVETKQTDLAIDFVNECNALGLRVLTVNVGDFGLRMPFFENLTILRSNGCKSNFTKNEYTLPSFIKDPLVAYFGLQGVMARPYTSRAVIGFCGQANISLVYAGKEIIKTSLRNLMFYVGLSFHEPQKLISTSFLRASILDDLLKSANVSTNFILRKKYRAGVKNDKDNHKTTYEFYDNIMDSDYIVCVRGAGNFSIRFYETLAMGRIPIFINTDSGLPFDDNIDWKKHVVWIEYNERHKVAEKVAHFHRALSEKEFIDLQLSNRQLWEKSLTLKGFFKTLIELEVNKCD